MPFKVMKLPYDTDALEPYISKKTLEVHYGKHYKKYVSTLNELTAGSRFEGLVLEDVILETFKEDNAIFHNAAQAWNHAFLWNSMSGEKSKPSDIVLAAIKDQFDSLQEFKDKFSKAATSLFGSGWVWLVRKSDGDLSIEALGNAGTPLTQGDVPLLVCDVWEHAYYLDYQNERSKYVNKFWQVLNWNFLEKNLNIEARYGENRAKRPPIEVPTLMINRS